MNADSSSVPVEQRPSSATADRAQPPSSSAGSSGADDLLVVVGAAGEELESAARA